MTVKIAVAIASTGPPPSTMSGIISITAENLPEKSSALATALVEEPRLREPKLREGAAVIKWTRSINRKTAL